MVEGIPNRAFRFGGLATGLDTESLIQGLLRIQRRPVALIEARRGRATAKNEAFAAFRARLQDLAATLGPLERTVGLDALRATSSVPGAVAVTANSGATQGTFTVQVDALAARGRAQSQGVSSPQVTIGSGSIDVTVAGKVHTIAVPDAGSTLADLRDLINAAGIGASATIVDTGQGSQPHRLVLTADATGTANGIRADEIDPSGLSGGSVSLAFTQLTDAADARVRFDGLVVTRSSNVFDDVLAGVSVEFLDDHGGQAFTIAVGRDASAIADRIVAFVDGLNAVLGQIEEHSRYTKDGGAGGALFGEALLRMTRSRLTQAVTGTSIASQSGFETLAALGITLGRDQRFQVDRATLESKIGSDFAAVARLFGEGPSGSASSPDGIAHVLAAHLDDLTATDGGWIESRRRGLSDVVDSFDRQVEQAERRLARFEELLRARFAALEVLVSGLQAQSQFL